MRIAVVGGGPSGLYFALLTKKRFPKADVRVYEQNPRDATYGFGIVLAETGLRRLKAADSESYEAIMAASFMSRNRIITHPEESFFVEGGGYGGAISRLRLLEILGKACTDVGITIDYRVRLNGAEDLIGSSDLVVGADGVNSVVRNQLESAFGTTTKLLTNRLAWYGTTRPFPYPILSFKKTSHGCFVAAGYSYTERMSTFVPECDSETWSRAGMHAMDEPERLAFIQEIFAKELSGSPLISNASAWRALPVIRNRNWFVGNVVLIGDALHSAHPTIGSGTRIAMEDSIALVESLAQYPKSLADALVSFRRSREPEKLKLVEASEKSFMWYEGFAEKVATLGAVDFVFDFLMRTGRINRDRLEAQYPEFMSRYATRWSGGAQTTDATAVSDGHTRMG